MRILQAIQELGVGGAERVVVTLVRAAREAGHESAVVAAPGPLETEIGVHRYDLPLLERRPWRIPLAALAIDRAVRAFRPDVVHVHNPGVGVAAALATFGGRRVPAVVSVHGVPDADYAAAARLLRLGKLPVVSCGPGVTAGLAEAGLEPYATVVNGVSAAPPAAERNAVVRALGLDPSSPLLLVVGRLTDVKNPTLPLRALPLLPAASLVYVGDGPLRATVERVAGEEGVADRVSLAGIRADARALMGAADAVVLPSHSEGLPLVALEALAAGTPLVATAVRGVRELLHDGEDALLVPPDDAPALAAAVERVLSDSELRGRLVERGRAIAARHSEAAMLDAFLSLYAQVGCA